MDAAEVADRAEIADLVARYSRAVDTRSWDDLDAIFAPDARIDYTAFGGIAGGPAEVKAYLAETMPMFASTMHMMGLPAIEVGVDGDGDRARSSTPCHNPMVFADGAVMVCELWYHHEFVRTAGGWRIASLHEEKCLMRMERPERRQ